MAIAALTSYHKFGSLEGFQLLYHSLCESRVTMVWAKYIAMVLRI